ncbi:receptor-type tyrosine-protein phosphatase gamma-like, partial [Tachysurus ichikawai]
MATYDDTLGLEAFIQRSIRVFQHLAACRIPEVEPAQAPTAAPEPEPMQLGSQRLSQQVGVLHQEEIQLLVLEDSTVDVILGHPWLAKHSPTCSWDPCDILEWGPACWQNCLRPLPTPLRTPLTLAATQVEGAPQPVQVDIPQEYQAFTDVFSEEAATQLPPHRQWDCAINLRPGAKLPKGRVYPLSAPEHRAMEGYIQQAFQQGFIIPYSSPAALGFFFVEKKDGGLQPCFDYRGLNAQISQLPYPLPLVCVRSCVRPTSSPIYIDDILIYSRTQQDNVTKILNLLREHRLYFNLPKCEFHHSEVQFLGYNISAAGKAKALSWNPEAQEAFEELRKRFCAAPLLHHPEPQSPFVVEVDASSTGVGATLSQQSGNQPRLHPCTYFSKKLSSAEQNYDIGWPSSWPRRSGDIGLRGPYIRLRSSQITRTCTKPILPPTLLLSPIIWELNEDIRAATRREPATPGCPENRIFVPRECRQALLRAIHEVPGSGHPGRTQTLHLAQRRYWWPGMNNMVAEFVQGCNICAISKTPRHLPVGKLIPLPTPQWPWSHIGIDFVTDLPWSEAFTCILVVMDRFSKACRFVPLRGLPRALETAKVLFQHVFRNFGLPEEIVSDRGSQFTSHVWRAFFRLLGVTVNLSSKYHPQSNGQTEQKIQDLGRYLEYTWRPVGVEPVSAMG